MASVAANIRLSNDVPFHDNFERYAPHYLLDKMIMNKPGSQKSKRSYVYAMQSVYAHLSNFERLFIQNLKRKMRTTKIALTANESIKMDKAAKEMEKARK